MSDLIRRKDVLEALRENLIEMGGDDFSEMGVHSDDIEAIVKNIPNAETTGALDDAIQEYIKDGYILAEPKVGKWEECKVVDIEDTTITEVQSAFCPICRKYHTTPYMYYFDYFAYCPNCGAKMEGRNNDD